MLRYINVCEYLCLLTRNFTCCPFKNGNKAFWWEYIYIYIFFLPMLEVLRDVNGLSLKLKPSSFILCWIGVLLFFLHLIFRSWICLSFVFWIDCTSPLVHRQCTRFVFHSNIYIFFHYLYRKKDKWVMIGYHTQN